LASTDTGRSVAGGTVVPFGARLDLPNSVIRVGPTTYPLVSPCTTSLPASMPSIRVCASMLRVVPLTWKTRSAPGSANHRPTSAKESPGGDVPAPETAAAAATRQAASRMVSGNRPRSPRHLVGPAGLVTRSA
jgi:hypothetical protein